MEKQAVEEARERFEWAKEAYTTACRATTYKDFKQAWVRFLNLHGAVFAKLSEGSKNSSASRSWMATHRKRRKDDPLLQYLHQARNSDEHGIKPVTGTRQWMGFRPSVAGGSLDFKIDGSGNIVFGPGPRPEITETEEWALVPVTNSKFGDTFYPPRTHLDVDLPDTIPHVVGNLGLAYVEKMLREAEALAIGP